ncbi:hypothetical protein DFJ73DRAFT_957305 [Zopfochytrium polystomum]|nr:hypothetical protein DFJ73DRAFT_957305 [Zopfochytrium polystomum]
MFHHRNHKLACSFKLQYFPFRGRGDPARLMLVAGGATWEDATIPHTPGEWHAVKYSMPYGQLPVLTEYDETGKEVMVVAQSKTIERYLAAKLDLSGTGNDHDRAILDSLSESLRDLSYAWHAALLEADQATAVQKFFEALPAVLKFQQKLIEKYGEPKGFYCGTKITYVDIQAYAIFSWIEDLAASDLLAAASNWEIAPRVKEIVDSAKAHPKLAAFVDSPERHVVWGKIEPRK